MSLTSHQEFQDVLQSDTLIRTMLPVCHDLKWDNECSLMPTEFSKSLYWKSLVLVGQNQLQRNGLLFQAALTCAALGKQVTFIAKKVLARFPPTTATMPQADARNMANITFKYCPDDRTLQELLIGYCTVSSDLLPDVLVVDGLNEYREGAQLTPFLFSKLLSLLSETVEYIGRRKQSTGLLFVSAATAIEDQSGWIRLIRKWAHEVWVLEGNSNRLVCGNVQVQFNVLHSAIYLRTVTIADTR